jgi:hypothetical protein
MGEGSTDLAPMVEWDEDGLAHNAGELVIGLETACRPRANLPETWHNVSRQWIIWHVIEHNLHHGGELSFSLACLG